MVAFVAGKQGPPFNEPLNISHLIIETEADLGVHA